MTDDDTADRDQIREAILRHFEANPMAAGTAEGIVECWIPRASYVRAPDHISAVLEDVVALGWLRAERLPDGSILYRRQRPQ